MKISNNNTHHHDKMCLLNMHVEEFKCEIFKLLTAKQKQINKL